VKRPLQNRFGIETVKKFITVICNGHSPTDTSVRSGARAGLAINASGVIRISLKNENGSLKSDQNFLWAVFNGGQENLFWFFVVAD
jgi:hypothetical protein